MKKNIATLIFTCVYSFAVFIWLCALALLHVNLLFIINGSEPVYGGYEPVYIVVAFVILKIIFYCIRVFVLKNKTYEIIYNMATVDMCHSVLYTVFMSILTFINLFVGGITGILLLIGVSLLLFAMIMSNYQQSFTTHLKNRRLLCIVFVFSVVLIILNCYFEIAYFLSAMTVPVYSLLGIALVMSAIQMVLVIVYTATTKLSYMDCLLIGATSIFIRFIYAAISISIFSVPRVNTDNSIYVVLIICTSAPCVVGILVGIIIKMIKTKNFSKSIAQKTISHE
ncbi:MAG: hypothetical protein E7532_07115 [Ruminococcaceae bacterium]|nr:hypothetical protein [Oscillospiraceae bacterium]